MNPQVSFRLRLGQKLHVEITSTAKEMYGTLKNKLQEGAFEALGTKENTNDNN